MIMGAIQPSAFYTLKMASSLCAGSNQEQELSSAAPTESAIIRGD
jgi:hypothetical protein